MVLIWSLFLVYMRTDQKPLTGACTRWLTASTQEHTWHIHLLTSHWRKPFSLKCSHHTERINPSKINTQTPNVNHKNGYFLRDLFISINIYAYIHTPTYISSYVYIYYAWTHIFLNTQTFIFPNVISLDFSWILFNSSENTFPFSLNCYHCCYHIVFKFAWWYCFILHFVHVMDHASIVRWNLTFTFLLKRLVVNTFIWPSKQGQQ